MPRKTTDALLVRLLDEQAAAEVKAEKWYRRLRRAFNALDKVRGQVVRLQRRIAAREAELAAAR